MQRQVQVWSGEVRGGMLVVRGESEPGKLEVQDGNQWRAATDSELRAVKVEEIAERLADREVYCLDPSLVDDMLRAGESLPRDLASAWSGDNVVNLRPDPSDWTLEQCREYLTYHGYSEPDPNPWTMDRAEMLEHMHIRLDDDFDNGDDEQVRAKLIAEMNEETWDGLEDWRDAVRDEAEDEEVLEWWRVSKGLAQKLIEVGEPVLDNDYGYWWGRTTIGQSFIMDGVFQRVAATML